MKNENKIAELGVNTSYKGNLTFDKHLKIKGKYNGSILSGGTLYIEDSALFEGDINVKEAVIAGQILGDVTATERIDILSNSVIKGNLIAPTIKIADGVQIEGRCQMIQDSDTVDIFSTSVSQLKKSVSII
ncbi:bactofilin family protein [Thiospirochaeta perfilievii]|uniref:bactofilin family protein n=1 Tax=Thiospirochaeta perfilievii TaxID=252967 RepID=UPI0016594A4F|nr:polymer-forming cytoskeletal protein [Thiospirochaeta perfilievii]